MVKRKATKSEPISPGPREPTLEESAAALRALGVDPARLLTIAARAEKRARGKTVASALEDDPRALFAPSVADALVDAAFAIRLSSGGHCEKVPELGDGLYLTSPTHLPKTAEALILGAQRALLSAPRVAAQKAHVRLVRDLRRAWKVQLEAERIAGRLAVRRTPDGKPDRTAVIQARQHVAEGEGISVEALQKCLREARASAPDAGWPEIMPERRGNRRA